MAAAQRCRARQRQSLVRLTPLGRRKVKPLLAQAQAHEAAVLAEVMAELGAVEVGQFKRVLERMIAVRSSATA